MERLKQMKRYETVQALHGCCLVCLVTEMSNLLLHKTWNL